MAISALEKFLWVDPCPAEIALVIFGGLSPHEICVLSVVSKDFKTYFRGVWIWRHFLFVDFAYYYNLRGSGVPDKKFIDKEILKKGEHILRMRNRSFPFIKAMVSSLQSYGLDHLRIFIENKAYHYINPDLTKFDQIYTPIPLGIIMEDPNSEGCYNFYKETFASVYKREEIELDPEDVTSIRSFVQQESVKKRIDEMGQSKSTWFPRLDEICFLVFMVFMASVIATVIWVLEQAIAYLARAFFKRCAEAFS